MRVVEEVEPDPAHPLPQDPRLAERYALELLKLLDRELGEAPPST